MNPKKIKGYIVVDCNVDVYWTFNSRRWMAILNYKKWLIEKKLPYNKERQSKTKKAELIIYKDKP